jgi:hypothetical protein
MTYKQTEKLIQKYLNGETTVDEEKLLALEVSSEDAPEDWKIIAGMLGELTIDEARFDQMMAERKHRNRIMKIWPWVAAACVVTLLVVFLTPPKEDAVTQSPIAKVAPNTKAAETVATETKVKEADHAVSEPQQISKVKRRLHRSKRIKKEKQEILVVQEAEPKSKTEGLVAVEKEDIIPFEDPMMQFAEQARALRERGNRVIQRVSMNTITPDNYSLNNL